MKTIKVLLVDDHALFRSGMRWLLSLYDDIAVVGEAGNGEDALDQIATTTPDVILMDVDLPGAGGVATTARIRAAYPHCHVLLLSGYQRYAAAGLQAGARGYVLKHADEDEIATAIRTVSQGGVYLQPEIQAMMVEMVANGTRLPFSERETAILRLVAQGQGNREIGDVLGLSERRVKQHMTSILERLDAHDRAHAVAIAMQQGLI